ncbi:hypothetical protein GUJ93_ZPchr0009g611 [Zizania palustris]|uniref:Uncharacterized protein n=1 Tax=Zizania palustris TaxID=103762 RepID=A0A8J5UZ59_ZIZPA|nr:hypothetical protein GUJ93_ZPchr0009g611 [Zizania palustris]
MVLFLPLKVGSCGHSRQRHWIGKASCVAMCSLKGMRWRDFHSCFGESGVQIANMSSSSSSAGKGATHNLVISRREEQP